MVLRIAVAVLKVIKSVDESIARFKGNSINERFWDNYTLFLTA